MAGRWWRGLLALSIVFVVNFIGIELSPNQKQTALDHSPAVPEILTGDATCQPWRYATNSSFACEEIVRGKPCQRVGAKFLYIFHFCIMKNHFGLSLLMLLMLMFVTLYGMVLVADEFLCPTIEQLAEHLKLPPDVAGATILSFGNGAPDIFSQYAAIQVGTEGSISLALGSVMGAGLFVTTFVLGSVIEAAPAHHEYISLNREAVLRDTWFYFVAVCAVLWCIMRGQVTTASMSALCGLYLVYVLFVVLHSSRRDNSEREDDDVDYEETPLLLAGSDNDGVHHDSTSRTIEKMMILMRAWVLSPLKQAPRFVAKWTIPGSDTNVWSWSVLWKAVLGTLLFSGAYVRFPLVALGLISVVGVAQASLRGSCAQVSLPYTAPLLALCFIFSVLWMHSLGEVLVVSLELVGGILRINSELLGATLLAWSNSSGDLIVNTEVSKTGYPGMAIAACYGGPLFTMLVGFGFSLLFHTARNGPIDITPSARLLVLFGFHIVQLLHAALGFPLLYRWRIPRRVGLLMISFYCLFAVVYGLVAIGILDLECWNPISTSISGTFET